MLNLGVLYQTLLLLVSRMKIQSDEQRRALGTQLNHCAKQGWSDYFLKMRSTNIKKLKIS